jgi:hypothetical protein
MDDFIEKEDELVLLMSKMTVGQKGVTYKHGMKYVFDHPVVAVKDGYEIIPMQQQYYNWGQHMVDYLGYPIGLVVNPYNGSTPIEGQPLPKYDDELLQYICNCSHEPMIFRDGRFKCGRTFRKIKNHKIFFNNKTGYWIVNPYHKYNLDICGDPL